jgi:DNA-binding response OmpR family regulator
MLALYLHTLYLRHKMEVDMQKKILLIDDESSLRRTLALGLSQRGYDTEPCEDGMNGLKKLELFIKNDLPPAAVVIDIQLPDINGTRLAKIIRFRYPGIPIILITGYADRLNPEEIKNLKVHAFMEKPFSSDELVDQFESILRHQKEPEPVVHPEEQESRSESAYLLVKTNKNADLFDIYRALYYQENVVYCDATKGEYDIFLLIQGNSVESLERICEDKIKSIEGVETVDFLAIGNPILEESTSNVIHVAEDALSSGGLNTERERDLGNRVCSYILVETEREKLESVYPALRLNENIVYCDYTSGKYNIVLLIHGTHFNEIDKIIQEKIINLDGVLRVKEYPIINLFEM